MKRPILILFAILFVAGIAAADEGMWLYNFPPTAQLKAKYKFDLTPAWLDHTRLSSVRFNNGGSGSFVSANGLTFTNHHVGSECIQQLSTGGKDYLKTGFHAKTQAEEAKCPNLELNVLEGIEDVTPKVNAAAKPNMSVADQAQAQRAEMSAIEQQCATETKQRCDVITLYSGAMYNLYKYKKYTDVRLVFAPEFDAAFFGGDPDNFEYPRYDLDICFFRIYENGEPVHLDNYFKWSTAGVQDGDLIFVSGNPGSTGRLNTMAQLEFLRDTAYPLALRSLARRDDLLKKFSAGSEENARIAQEDIFGYENSLKAFKGYQSGLLDKAVMAKKSAEENKMRQAIASDPKKKDEFGDPWPEIAKAMAFEKQIYLPLNYLDRLGGLRGDLAGVARVLVRAAAERAKPNGERLPEYTDKALVNVQQQLAAAAPVYKDLEELNLVFLFTVVRRDLGTDDPLVRKMLGKESPEQLARRLVTGTHLDDPKVREELYNGGQSAVDASNDPMIRFVASINGDLLAIRKDYEARVDAPTRSAAEKIAKARFAVYGTSVDPDATFTLRLTYGTVKGFEDGEGKFVEPYTNIGGLFERATGAEPYALPESWLKAKASLNLSVPMNLSTTNDTTGGNSGSPMIDKDANIVGLLFDGNIFSLGGDYGYDVAKNRSIAVDSRGLLEGMRKVYHIDRIVDEIEAARK